MPNQTTILYFSLPVLIGAALVEGMVLNFVAKRAYNWRGFLASMADLLTRHFVVGIVLPISVVTPLISLALAHRPFTIPLNGFLAFGALVIAQDFCWYWYHRCAHRVRWLWASHAVHHSTNEFNLSAAVRFGWTARISGDGIFYVPLIWLGYPPSAVYSTLALNLLYQYWTHAEWCPKLGWLEYVLNTPAHHRLHHSANVEYLDANYGGIFIIFDQLFGTLVVERENVPCRYGLVRPLLSNNPVKIAFHSWVAMAADFWRARTWRERFLYLFGPPGWAPAGGTTTAELRHAAATVAAE